MFEYPSNYEDQLKYDRHWVSFSLPKAGTVYSITKTTVVMDKAYFAELGEYSSTLPTGTYIGKKWKRRIFQKKSANSMYWVESPGDPWMMGEYYALPEFYIVTRMILGPRSRNEIGIRWRKINVIDAARAE